MIKYVPSMTSVVMEEIPDRVTLAVDISNCQGNCTGCHSPFLREDIGEPLTEEVIDVLVRDNFGIDCFLFLGEGRDPEALVALAGHVRNLGLKAALYSGRPEVEPSHNPPAAVLPDKRRLGRHHRPILASKGLKSTLRPSVVFIFFLYL